MQESECLCRRNCFLLICDSNAPQFGEEDGKYSSKQYCVPHLCFIVHCITAYGSLVPHYVVQMSLVQCLSLHTTWQFSAVRFFTFNISHTVLRPIVFCHRYFYCCVFLKSSLSNCFNMYFWRIAILILIFYLSFLLFTYLSLLRLILPQNEFWCAIAWKD
jgi:hypothetical protein